MPIAFVMKCFIILFLSPAFLFAEYRVFELTITNTKTKKSRKVHSQLDAIQYRDYHHLQSWEKLKMTDTWMCWKRHKAYVPLCKRPVTLDSLKAESGQFDPESP